MLRNLWQSWLTLARKIGNFQSRIILTVLYFLVVTPFGLLVRAFGDPLGRKLGRTGSSWVTRTTRDVDLAAGRKQS